MLSFRKAMDDDALAVVQLRQRIWRTTYRGIYPDAMLDDFDTAWHLKMEKSRLQRPDFSVFLMEEDQATVGYVTLRTGTQAVLQSLYVLKEYQGRGIGREAMAFVRACFRRCGRDSFICECHPANGKARSFYEKQGGVMIGTDLDNEEHWQDGVTYQFQV